MLAACAPPTDRAPRPERRQTQVAPAAELFVAPGVRGQATGGSAAHAAGYRDAAFWSRVAGELANGPVTVRFAAGDYLQPLFLSHLGHDEHRLSLVGDRAGGTVFRGSVETQFEISRSRNISLSNLHFRGNISGYGLVITQSSQDIHIDRCSWVDLREVYFGALGIHRRSKDIRVSRSRFERLGQDSHAHMIYVAYDVQDVTVEDNRFTDCSGSYVRYRDSDRATTRRNTFIHTGTYHNATPPMIEVAVFNDVDPGDEWLGTNLNIHSNRFQFAASGAGPRMAIRFHHGGFDPPGRRYLLTRSEANTLTSGPLEQRRELLDRNFGLDWRRVFLRDNQYSGVDRTITLASYAHYGATSQGWEGTLDITAILGPVPDSTPIWWAVAVGAH